MTGRRDWKDVDASEMTEGGWVEVGVRRVPELEPVPLPESQPILVERIAAEIRRSGPMTFARFMQRALYELGIGYYETEASGPGRAGDFLTAPESHPIFGWTVARQLEEVWRLLDRPGRFVVREHGAGTGALAVGVLDGLTRSGSDLLAAIRYQPIDVARPRLDALAARLTDAGFGDVLESPDGRPELGAVLANELLDALPVHRVEGGPPAAGGRPRQLLERFVDLDSAGTGASPILTTVLGQPSTPDLAARLAGEGVELAPGQPAEICLALDEWLERAAAPLDRGLMLLIDYGAPALELYALERGSTLRAYHHHRVHADPFVAVGRQDLTAHVDLTAVERAAAAAGLTRLGRTKQADFLAALGIGDILVGLQSNLATTLESYLEARSAVVRMLDPRATGAFAVLGFGRGLQPGTRLAGFGA